MSLSPEDDVAEIRRLIEEQVSAYNDGDAARFLQSNSERRITMNPNQSATLGPGDENELQRFFDSVDQTVSLEVDEVVVFGDWAFERGEGHGTLTPKLVPAGVDPTARYSYKYIRIWERESDGWRVTRSIWNSNDQRTSV